MKECVEALLRVLWFVVRLDPSEFPEKISVVNNLDALSDGEMLDTNGENKPQLKGT